MRCRIQCYPGDVRLLNDPACIIQEQGQDLAQALTLADRGVEQTPNDENLLDTWATILEQMPDRLDDARRDFDTLRRLCLLDPARRPRLAKALLKLARVCVALDDNDEAKRHLTKALEVDGEIVVLSPQEKGEIGGMLKAIEEGKAGVTLDGGQ